MAYYKRNGLVLVRPQYASSGVNSNNSVDSVKYDTQTGINEGMLNALANRLLILLEERIAGIATGKFNPVVKEDRVSVNTFLIRN